MDVSAHDAFILVDMQVDFCPGGALPVKDGDRVIPVLNRWLKPFTDAHRPIFASRDWHPPHHISFRERGGPWPPHCVQHTPGAAFHPDLAIPEGTVIISKGSDPERDAYSAFDGTDLAQRLLALDIRRLTVGGLAQDYCVHATVLEALAEGFAVRLLQDGTRPVEVQPGDGERALAEMREAGAEIVTGEQP
ncbi:MAG: nicotinamidase [Pseudomonadota bacterium]